MLLALNASEVVTSEPALKKHSQPSPRRPPQAAKRDTVAAELRRAISAGKYAPGGAIAMIDSQRRGEPVPGETTIAAVFEEERLATEALISASAPQPAEMKV